MVLQQKHMRHYQIFEEEYKKIRFLMSRYYIFCYRKVI